MADVLKYCKVLQEQTRQYGGGRPAKEEDEMPDKGMMAVGKKQSGRGNEKR